MLSLPTDPAPAAETVNPRALRNFWSCRTSSPVDPMVRSLEKAYELPPVETGEPVEPVDPAPEPEEEPTDPVVGPTDPEVVLYLSFTVIREQLSVAVILEESVTFTDRP